MEIPSAKDLVKDRIERDREIEAEIKKFIGYLESKTKVKLEVRYKDWNRYLEVLYSVLLKDSLQTKYLIGVRVKENLIKNSVLIFERRDDAQRLAKKMSTLNPEKRETFLFPGYTSPIKAIVDCRNLALLYGKKGYLFTFMALSRPMLWAIKVSILVN